MTHTVNIRSIKKVFISKATGKIVHEETKVFRNDAGERRSIYYEYQFKNQIKSHADMLVSNVDLQRLRNDTRLKSHIVIHTTKNSFIFY